MFRLHAVALGAGAVLLAACNSSSSSPSATTAAPSAAPPASAEAAREKLPANAAIRFHWFSYASPTRNPHKLWLEPMDPQKPVLMLTYAPDAGASPPREQVPAEAREPLAKAIEAANLGAWRPAPPKPGVGAKWNYVLSVSWPREGQMPASRTVSWTDATETPELAAVRKAMVELATSKFPVVVNAAPR
jgi:hypothetical protein